MIWKHKTSVSAFFVLDWTFWGLNVLDRQNKDTKKCAEGMGM